MAYEMPPELLAELRLARRSGSKVDALRSTCVELAVPAGMWSELVHIVIEMSLFERTQSGQLPSGKQRMQALESVRRHAQALRQAVAGLPNAEYMRLDCCLHDHLRSTSTDAPIWAIQLAVQQVAAIELAAADALQATIDAGVKKSRPPIVVYRAGFIAGLACLVRAIGLKPTMSDRSFVQLCDAVFEAAGVQSRAEGPVRLFVREMRSEYKARGLCL